jgi:hypothetical protein
MESGSRNAEWKMSFLSAFRIQKPLSSVYYLPNSLLKNPPDFFSFLPSFSDA